VKTDQDRKKLYEASEGLEQKEERKERNRGEKRIAVRRKEGKLKRKERGG